MQNPQTGITLRACQRFLHFEHAIALHGLDRFPLKGLGDHRQAAIGGVYLHNRARGRSRAERSGTVRKGTVVYGNWHTMVAICRVELP